MACALDTTPKPPFRDLRPRIEARLASEKEVGPKGEEQWEPSPPRPPPAKACKANKSHRSGNPGTLTASPTLPGARYRPTRQRKKRRRQVSLTGQLHRRALTRPRRPQQPRRSLVCAQKWGAWIWEPTKHPRRFPTPRGAHPRGVGLGLGQPPPWPPMERGRPSSRAVTAALDIIPPGRPAGVVCHRPSGGARAFAWFSSRVGVCGDSLRPVCQAAVAGVGWRRQGLAARRGSGCARAALRAHR